MAPYRQHLVAAGLLLAAGPLSAAELFLDPSTGSVPVGGIVDIAIQLSGLPTDGPPSLASFVTTVLFDDALLEPVRWAYSDALGSPDLGDSFPMPAVLEPGSIKLENFSLLSGDALDAQQHSSPFSLATIGFKALTAGDAGLTMGTTDLLDDLGDPITPDAVHGAVITAEAMVPPTVWLLLAPAGWLWWRRGGSRSGAG